MKYLVVIEQGPDGFGAYLPDIPGCVAVGASTAEVMLLIEQAVDWHVQSMVNDGESLPPPSSRAALLEVAACCSTPSAANSRVRRTGPLDAS